MKTRIISGLVMVPLLLFIYFGGYPLLALTLFIGAAGVTEFYKGFEETGIHPWRTFAYVMTGVLYLGYVYMYYMGDFEPYFVMAWLAAVIIIGSTYMFKVGERTPEDAMVTIVGLIYIVFFSFHMVLVDQHPEYSILKWLILITAFGSDIFAYFTGMLIGKNKLCPDLSPKKTWEGAVGGVIGSAVLSALFGFLFAKELLVHCIIIGLVASPVSMLGDLTASAYKRKMGIKDYGKLIPGHGGIMDRFDSVLFTAPFVFYYIVIVLDYFIGG